MAQNQNPVTAGGGGGFFRILGIIYLVKVIRQRREGRRAAAQTHGDTTRPG